MKIRFDSETMDIVKPCLLLLNIPIDENIFSSIVEELVQLKHIIFSDSIVQKQLVSKEKQKIAKISNKFIDTYLQPILSTNSSLNFEFIDAENSPSVRYEDLVYFLFVFFNVSFISQEDIIGMFTKRYIL